MPFEMIDDRCEWPLLMLSLPNSGSSWLASLIAAHTPWNRYRMEFFNPIRSSVYYDTLRRNFGCELIDCYRNIVTRGDANIHRDIEQTWQLEQYNFTKEVFSPLKLPVFVRHFRCFVLLRDAGDSLPPRRLRIWSFYEHAWYALRDLGHPLVAGASFQSRAQEAFGILQNRMLQDAFGLNVPVMDYADLFDDSKIERVLQECLGMAPLPLVQAIREGRQRFTRSASEPSAPTADTLHPRRDRAETATG